jgi:hypothetical protein
MAIRNILKISMILLMIAGISCRATEMQEDELGYPITAVSFTKVTLTDDFWSGRIETNRTVTIPFGFKKCEEEGRMRNFARAGGLMEGQ